MHWRFLYREVDGRMDAARDDHAADVDLIDWPWMERAHNGRAAIGHIVDGALVCGCLVKGLLRLTSTCIKISANTQITVLNGIKVTSI